MTRFPILAALGVVFLILCGTAQAQTDASTWLAALDRAESVLKNPKASPDAHARARSEVRAVIDDAKQDLRAFRREAGLLDEMIAALGPAPAKGSAPEPKSLAAQRKDLERRAAATAALVKTAELAVIRGDRLIQAFVDIRRDELWEKLRTRGPSPLRPASWARAYQDVRVAVSLLRAATTEWIASSLDAEQWQRSAGIVAATAVLSLLLGWPARLWLLRRFGQTATVTDPSYLRRLIAAPMEGVARGLLPALALVSVLVVLIGLDLVHGLFSDMLSTVVSNFVLFLLVATTARVTFAPRHPEWRLVPFSDASAEIAANRVIALAAILAVGNALAAIAGWMPVSAELDSVFTFLFSTICAVAVILLMQNDAWISDDNMAIGVPGRRAPSAGARALRPRLRAVVYFIALVTPLAAAFGYAGIAKYLLINTILTGLLFAAVTLAHGLFSETVTEVLSGGSNLPPRLNRFLNMSEGTRATMAFSLSGLFDLLLLILVVVAGMSVWGMQPEDIYATAGKALQGVSIGSYTFSLTDFLLAVGLFVAILLGTRGVQWVLEDRVLPHTKLDRGVRDSLSKAIWYVGLVTAVFLSVSTLGINFSNVAIVAGALSVGIGFGLQNLVNNFVSGLILLIERPLKVGDWVVLGNQEGHVKRINVRSTELSTFQKASVIVPNADILSSAFTNWTHKDLEGRAEIRVGVAYGSDVQAVKNILIQCATAHSEVKTSPAPEVLFMDFGDSALMFELRVFVHLIENRLRIASDLRFAIEEAFREGGVEIPFPQRVVHLSKGSA